jgi:phosphotransferase system HPr (HPr) family protein
VSTSEATLEIKNRLGLHLRAASTLMQALKPFDSSVTLLWGKKEANARSVTSLIMLGAGAGTRLKVKAEGPDAEAALVVVKTLFEDRFGED